jgi:endonuclease YncB( thermonuclease family)
MLIRICLCFVAALSFTACAALSSQISDGMAPQISTEVAIQVGTAVAELPAADTPAERDEQAAVTAPVAGSDETGLVTRVVDGDTIDVMLNGVNTRIRYLQMNTPERDHPCFDDSSQANADLVAGKTVRLVADKELVDPFDRLLRFVYVDDVLVNRVLVEQGWAEVVLYPPNDLHYDEFLLLEREAAAAGRGCHPSGVFDDGSTTR